MATGRLYRDDVRVLGVGEALIGRRAHSTYTTRGTSRRSGRVFPAVRARSVGTAGQFQKVEYGEQCMRDLRVMLARIETSNPFTLRDHPRRIAGAFRAIISAAGTHPATPATFEGDST